MRVFWAIVVVVMLVAAGTLLFGRGRSAPNGTGGPAPISEVVEREFKPSPVTTPRELSKPAPVPSKPAADAALSPAPAVGASGASKPVEGDGSHHTASSPEAPAPAKSAGGETGTSTHTTAETPAPATPAPKPPAPSAPPTAEAPTPSSLPPPTPAAPKPEGVVPADASSPFPADVEAKIVKQGDGSYLVDDKYVIKGKGTAEAPLEITWDYLISAQESYQPRLGKKKLPGRLVMLNGKEVKITGYVAFPVMAQEQTEMLMMLNQWDGCCIGVPPTAYDAIEVKLKEPAVGMDRLATYGSVRGKMKVEPYLVKDWLVSLYAMDGAVVTRGE